MPDYNLGTASGKIIIDASGVKGGVDSANKSLDQLGGHSDAAAKKVSTAFLAVGIGVAAGFGAAIKSSMEFEKVVSGIGAVTGATASQLDQVRAKALQLGKDTKFSAGEAATAIEELAKAGLTLPDIMNGAADATVALAAAGEIDLPQAATIASNAMNMFQLQAEQLPHIADLLAGAANASAVDVSQLGQSLQQVGAVANVVGFSIDDVTIALGEMGNAGIRGSDAGTSLKTFLERLAPTTDKAAALMSQLGLITEDGANQFFDASGKVKSYSQVSQILQDALKNQTKEQQLTTLTTLFGTDAVRAAAIAMQNGASGADAFAEAMGKVSAADVAAKRMDNLAGSVEQFKGSLETIGIVIGGFAQGPAKQLVDAATNLLNMWLALNPQTQQWSLVIIGATGAALGLIGAMAKLNSGLAGAGGLIAPLGGALSQAFAPLLAHPIVALVVAIVAAFVLLYVKVEAFRNFINNAWDTIRTGAQQAFGWLQENVPPIWDKIKNGAQQAFDWMEKNVWPVIQKIADVLVQFGQKAAEIFGKVADWVTDTLVPAVTDFFSKVAGYAQQFADWFNEWVMPVIQAAIDLFIAIRDKVVEVFDEIFPVIQTFGETIADILGTVIDDLKIGWDTIAPVVKEVFGVIVGLIQGSINTIVAIWDAGIGPLINIVSTVFGSIKNAIESVLRAIQGVIEVITSAISGDWGKAWEGIQDIFSGIWHAITEIPRVALETIKNLIQAGIGIVLGVWSTGWNTLVNFLSGIWSTITTGVSSGLQGLLSWFSSLPGKIITALGDLASTLLASGKALIEGLMNGITGKMLEILAYFGKFPGWVIAWIGDLLGTLTQKGRDLLIGLLAGITEKVTDVISWFTNLPSAILDWLKSFPDCLVEMGKKVLDGLWRGMKAGWDKVTGWLSSLNPANWFNDINVEKGHAEKNLYPMGILVFQGLQAGAEIGWNDFTIWLEGLNPSEFIADPFTKAIDATAKAFDPLIAKVSDALKPAVAASAEDAKKWDNAWNDAVKSIGGHIDPFTDQVTNGLDAIGEGVQGSAEDVKSWKEQWDLAFGDLGVANPFDTVTTGINDFSSAIQANADANAAALERIMTNYNDVAAAQTTALDVGQVQIWRQEFLDTASIVGARVLEIAFAYGLQADQVAKVIEQVQRYADEYRKNLTTITTVIGAESAKQIADLGLTGDQMKIVADQAARFKDNMTQAFKSTTDLVSAFSGKTEVSSQDVVKFLGDQVAAAAKWSQDLKTLAASGLDQGIVQEIAEAGPKAQPLLTALLQAVAEGNKEAINKAQQDLNSILNDTITTVGGKLDDYWVAGSEVGDNIAQGIATGIMQNSEAVQGVMHDFIVGLLEAAKQAAGISSPSILFRREIGGNILGGIREAFKKDGDFVFDAARDFMLNLADVADVANATVGKQFSFNPGNAIPLSPTPTASSLQGEVAKLASTHIEVAINNPVAEPASDSMYRTLNSFVYAGVFGD